MNSYTSVKGWNVSRIGDLVDRVVNPVDVDRVATYQEIGVRSHGNGIFYKASVSGEELGNKRVFWVEPDCFVVNIVFAWEQAMAKTTEAERGMIASHRFPMYRPKTGCLDLDYLLLFFYTSYGKHLLNLASPGGAGRNKTLGQEAFQELSIPLPPLPEQRKIAEILGTWDEAIRLTAELIAAKQQRKKGLMQRLLTGEVRFPEFIGSDSKQSAKYFQIPADWSLVKIGNLASQITTKNVNDQQLPVLSCTKHDGLVDSLEYFGRQIFSDDISTYKVVQRGQFAYATNHIEEGSIGYQDKYDMAVISPMYTVFQTDSTVDDRFLYRVLKTETYRQIFELNTNASVNRRGSLRWKEFSKIQVPIPSLEEQRRIADFFEACDMEINLLQQKLTALQQQKKGLMQRLLTGEVRVKV